MGFFSSDKKEANKRYIVMRDKNIAKAQQQSFAHKINPTAEAAKIGTMCQIQDKRQFPEYKDIATWILSSYEPELAFVMIGQFAQFAPRLGYVPIGKIMLAIEHIDSIQGGILGRKSLFDEYPSLPDYVSRSEMRTDKAITVLTTGICTLVDIDDAKSAYKVLQVPEMVQGIKDRLFSIDELVGKYITK
jgi:hypothetical protein